MREIAHDRCGSPLYRLASGALIHLLPVTVYHVERFIWETAPASEIVAARAWNERPVPDSVDRDSAGILWATGLSVVECGAVAQWLGGRVPTCTEWEEACGAWASAAFRQNLAPSFEGDRRVARLISRLQAYGVSQRAQITASGYGEFATEYGRPPLGTVSIMSTSGSSGVVTSAAGPEYRDGNVGFCCVIDSKGRMGWA